MSKPLPLFLLIQCFGGIVFAFLSYLDLSVVLCVFLSACCSCVFAKRFHVESWWTWIHIAFLPLVYLSLKLALPSYIYLIAFIVTWIVFGQIAKSRVPLFLSEVEALAVLAERTEQGATFLDIGAGTGRVLAHLTKARPDLHLFGVELALLPWLYGWWTLRKQVHWQRANYHDVDFSQFDYIYAYLSPAAMSDLWEKARQEMKPGSWLISNSFAVDGQIPTETISLNDWKNGKLLIWQM